MCPPTNRSDLRSDSPTPPASGGSDALTPAVTLGRYTVLGIVGKGAMGEVYAAYDPELDRKIAIKLLRVGAREEGVATEGRIRLMREAQAIAKLSHANVVTVYDVGTFRDDVFIAMQFVDGCTLRYWIHAQPRTWSEVVKVFADAGHGLAAAHEKDLIHRDFKPDNVMVGADGHVRVMDFGLARAALDRDRKPAPAAVAGPKPAPAAAADVDTGADLDSTRVLGRSSLPAVVPDSASEALSVELTQAGAVLGTPAYMSPEQFQGDAIDARSDQFSFCVALYEALYGERPFSGTTLLDLMAGVLDGTVRTPPAGSKVPSWVRKIMLRGLRVDPCDRWPSMTAMLGELEKSRRGAPRRRFAAGATAKLAGIWEATLRGRAGDTAVKTEVRRAFLATGKTYAAATFDKVRAILDRYAQAWSEMYVDACEATHLRGEQSAEVLDLRMAGLDECLDGLRALSQAFRQANAEVVENAVSAANALSRIERCADIELLRAVVRPPEDPGARATVDRLRTQLAEIRVLHNVGRLNEGLEAIGPLVDEVRRTDYGPLLAETLFELGNLHLEQRAAGVGAPILEEALWTAELCRHDEVVAMAAAQLVYAVGDQLVRFEAGEIWARYAETRLLRMGGREDLWGWLYNNRGAMRERQGRLPEAIDDARRAVAAKEKFHGPDSTEVGLSLNNIAMYMAVIGDLANALTYMQRGINAVESGVGPDHPRIGVLLSNYAEILNQLGRFAEAREMARRALAIFERETSIDSSVLSYPLTALGLGYLGEGMVEEALSPLERAVAIRDRNEKRPASLGEVHFALACALKRAGREAPRARALALAARAEYASDASNEANQRWAEQIDAWLATDAAARDAAQPLAAGAALVADAGAGTTAPRPLRGSLPS